jgi:23S rRNA (cytidine1920-2'-O)/16S rRNA (cytidine1409-2'-O)-methyltransferase
LFVYGGEKNVVSVLISFVGWVNMNAMRLDLVLVQHNLYPTRARAVAAIDAGLVTVNGVVAKKPSQQVIDSDIIVGGDLPYSVGRGSLKLARALDQFNVKPENMICLDVGASTGGFTDVLLKAGARRVYAVDVGTNQLAPELRADSRVVSMEQTDIRDVVPTEPVDLIVIDVSFISLTNIVGTLPQWKPSKVITLIKPQFEVPREIAARFNGVIKSKEWHEYSVNRVVEEFAHSGFRLCGDVIVSPVLGGSGNTEFLACFEKSN